ncbi:MAG: LytR C-terminal domain-containing protein [Ilumatobacteraceae bacterium]
MSYDNPGRTTRPPSRSSSSAPMGSTVAIVVTAIAVLLAFFILRKVNESGDTSSVTPGTAGSETTLATVPGDTSLTTLPATETTTSFTKVGTSIQVINCSNQEGVARNMSTALVAEGFTTVEPDTGTIDLAETKIIYNPDDAAALNVANTLATYLSDAVVEPSGPNVPTLLGAWAPGSSVIVLLGDDMAGKTLAQIAGLDTTGTTGPSTSGA